jgi:TonB family protein
MYESDERAPPAVAVEDDWPEIIQSDELDEQAAALPAELSDLSRPAEPVDLEELDDALSRYRVLVVRDRGVPVSLLAVVAGSFLFNAAFLALLFWAYRHVGAVPFLFPGHAVASEQVSDGGSGSPTLTIMGDEGPPTGAVVAPNVGELTQGDQQKATAAPLPTLPELPRSKSMADANDGLLSSQTPDLIGVPVDGGQSAPHMPAPKLPPSAVSTLRIEPPMPAGDNAGARGSSETVAAGPSVARVNVGVKAHGAFDPGDDDDTGDVVQMMKPGKGSGEGEGTGDGLDRGPSGDNNEHPGILSIPRPQMPLAAMLKAQSGYVALEFEVLADGSVGEIKIAHSCGDPDVDTACRVAVAGGKYRPAYRNGKPFAAGQVVRFTLN